MRKHPLAVCEECPLQDAPCAPSTGVGSKIALVSRSPGQHDVHNGAPFTGPSGEVVDYLLKKNGTSREKVMLTNIVLCQTDEPSKEAIKACKPRLDSELSNSETIIAAGSEAVRELTGKGTVSGARGYVIEREGKRIVAANNPALVLRDSDTFPTLITDFKLALNPLPSPIFPEVEIINDPARARDSLREWIKRNDPVTATDLEWAGTTIYCAGFSIDSKRATVFGRRVIEDPECFGLIKRLYESDTTHSCWHNGKSDTTILWQNGIRGRVDEDTLLLSYALDEEPGRHSLDYLLQTNFGWPYYEPAAVTHFKETGKLDYYGTDDISIAKAEYELYEYNGWDCAGTFQLYHELAAQASFAGVYDRPYKQTLLPAADAFRHIEMNGFKFNAEESANIIEAEVIPFLTERTAEMREVSGAALLNPRSTQQMASMYYDKWGVKHSLKKIKNNKNIFARSTGKEVREEIRDGRFTYNPGVRDTVVRFSALHQRYAKVEKQRSTYFQKLIEECDENGYIHPWFNIAGTVSGRTSSTKPNFQNITRSGSEGIQSIRTLFLPSDGNLLIQADYSQAELRTMAVLSQDPNLLAIYNDNTRSLHKERAAAFYGENYTYEEYVKSKNINFGVSYGQSAKAFAQMYHMPKEEAQAYIDSWWREFPRLKAWTEEVGNEALTGEVITPFGYHRRFHLITRENLEDIKREAVNTVPQNTAGVLTIHAVTELVLTHGVRVVNTVHDSIVADHPEDEVKDVAILMQNVMQRKAKELLDWDLPFNADISVGETWATVEEVEYDLAA